MFNYKVIFTGILLMMLAVFTACGNEEAGSNDQLNDTSEGNSTEERSTEEQGDKMNVINVHDFDFQKTEEDLKVLMALSKEDSKGEDQYPANTRINKDPYPVTMGQESLLYNEYFLVDKNGLGHDFYEDQLTDGFLRYQLGYEEGTYYLPYDTGLYTVDEKTGEMGEVVTEHIDILKTDESHIYYITSPEGEDTYTLKVLNREDHKEMWAADPLELGFAGLGMLDVVPMEDYVIFKTKDFLKALDKDTGEVIWETEDRFFQVAEAGDALFGIIYTGNHTAGEFTLTELDHATGETRHSLDLPQTFAMYNQDYPEFTVKDDMLLIDLEQSVLGYDIQEKKPTWALAGNEGFHQEEMNIGNDMMDVDVAVTPEGQVMVSGSINSSPDIEEDLQYFITTVDPKTGEISDGYLIGESIERNFSSNHNYDYQILITRNRLNDTTTDEDFQGFLGTVE